MAVGGHSKLGRTRDCAPQFRRKAFGLLGAALATVLVVSGMVALFGGGVARAAGTPGVNDYPYQSAVNCSSTYGAYSWCIGGNDLSPMGFGYRNCTDFVAWRDGLTYASFIKSGDGNAVGWKAAAAARRLHREFDPDTRSYRLVGQPRSGAATGTSPNVMSVNGNGTAYVQQYNQAGTGVYSQSTGVSADDYLYVNVTSGGGGGGGAPMPTTPTIAARGLDNTIWYVQPGVQGWQTSGQAFIAAPSIA